MFAVATGVRGFPFLNALIYFSLFDFGFPPVLPRESLFLTAVLSKIHCCFMGDLLGVVERYEERGTF